MQMGGQVECNFPLRSVVRVLPTGEETGCRGSQLPFCTCKLHKPIPECAEPESFVAVVIHVDVDIGGDPSGGSIAAHTGPGAGIVSSNESYNLRLSISVLQKLNFL
jgi:hypothetical protein